MAIRFDILSEQLSLIEFHLQQLSVHLSLGLTDSLNLCLCLLDLALFACQACLQVLQLLAK